MLPLAIPATAAVEAELSEPSALATFLADFLCFALCFDEAIPPDLPIKFPLGAGPTARIYLSTMSA